MATAQTPNLNPGFNPNLYIPDPLTPQQWEDYLRLLESFRTVQYPPKKTFIRVLEDEYDFLSRKYRTEHAYKIDEKFRERGIRKPRVGLSPLGSTS